MLFVSLAPQVPTHEVLDLVVVLVANQDILVRLEIKHFARPVQLVIIRIRILNLVATFAHRENFRIIQLALYVHLAL